MLKEPTMSYKLKVIAYYNVVINDNKRVELCDDMIRCPLVTIWKKIVSIPSTNCKVTLLIHLESYNI